jgi:hypothetical protein
VVVSRAAEIVLYQHLVDPDSLRTVLAEDIDIEILPTPELRPVFGWAVRYYLDGGLTKAPSSDAFRDRWGSLLDDHEVDLEDEPADTVEWAIERLKSAHAYREGSQFTLRFAQELGGEDSHHERVEIVRDAAQALTSLSTTLEPGVHRVEATTGLDMALRSYEARTLNTGEIVGARLARPQPHVEGRPLTDLEPIDVHTNGIRHGELVVLAAGPKVGKSFAMARAALANWEAGLPTVLFTLENSIEMTYDRMACMAAHVDPTRWQEGRCSIEEYEAVVRWVAHMQAAEDFWVMQPPLGAQDFDSMVASARVRGAECIVIDQLTFVELPVDGHKPKHERIGEGLHRLKKLISTGRHPMACLLAHQINREGVKAADKVGYLEMHHLAESAEVERTADWVFGLYRSRDDVHANAMRFQTLAARRAPIKNWMLRWDIGRGLFIAEREFELG